MAWRTGSDGGGLVDVAWIQLSLSDSTPVIRDLYLSSDLSQSLAVSRLISKSTLNDPCLAFLNGTT